MALPVRAPMICAQVEYDASTAVLCSVLNREEGAYAIILIDKATAMPNRKTLADAGRLKNTSFTTQRQALPRVAVDE